MSSRFNQRQQIAQKKPQEGDRHQEPRGQSAAARNVAQKTDQTDAVCVSGTNNNENQIRPEGFESCLWTCPQFHYNLLRHIVSPLVHVVSPGLVTRISSPEREGVWLTDLPSFIERRHNGVWQRVLLRNAFQILCKLGCARCAKDNTVPVREG